MLTLRVDLRFPLDIPGGKITFLTARPLTQAEFDHSFTSPAAPYEAFASCVGLPVHLVGELSAVDYDRVSRAIASLNRSAAEEALASRRPTLTVVSGANQ